MPKLGLSFLAATGLNCCALLWAGQVSAEPPATFRFYWSAPEGCPSQQQIHTEIARLVGGDIQLHEGDLEARATVSYGPLWSADLTTQHSGQTGHRRIEGPSCKAVADAISLIVALLIDPDAVAANSLAPEPAVPALPKLPEPPKSDPRHLAVWVGLHAQGRMGAMPEADIGLGLGLGVAGARWRTDVRWNYGLRRDPVASLPSGASGRFNITAGSVTECFNLGQTRWEFGPCAALEAGRVSVKGFGATAGFSKNVLWLALGGGAFLSRPMGQHLRATLEVDVITPMYRPDYVFQAVPGVVFRAPALGGRALAEISWHF